MSRVLKLQLVGLLGFVPLITGCSEVPITGRRQLNLVPDSMIQSMSFESYKEFLSQNKLSADVQKTEMVRRVGQRISKSVEQYFAENNLSDELKGYDWEFNLVEDDAVNAWAMPGGKVVVYTGLLPVARDDKGLAVVMGHEVAHAVANHGGERMTQGLLVEMGGMALSEAMAKSPEQTKALFMKSYSVGTQVGILLPYSRKHESESDHMGLIFMAMAGYDPQESVDFWQRMAAAKKGQAAPPELLSTHPADETRIAKIKELLPDAMKYYKPAAGQ